MANQFRALITAAAYVLMQELRLKAKRTGCARAQVSTLRLRVLTALRSHAACRWQKRAPAARPCISASVATELFP